MDWTRRLPRHKDVYRTINLPFYISQRLIDVDEIQILYDEATSRITIVPLRPASGTSAKATEAKAEPSRKDINNNTPQAHFSL